MALFRRVHSVFKGRGRRSPGPRLSRNTVSRRNVAGFQTDGRGGRSGAPWVGVVAVFVLAFLLAACGGGSPPTAVARIGTNAPTTTTLPAAGPGGMPSLQHLYQDAVAYIACMRSHGVPNLRPPTMVNSATEQEVGFGLPPAKQGQQYRAADKICKVLLPDSGGGPSQAQVQQVLAKDLRFSHCMRSHGLPSFPDPKEGSSGISIGPAPGINPKSPQFQAAQKDCRSLAPIP